jgi:hypothetical protein
MPRAYLCLALLLIHAHATNTTTTCYTDLDCNMAGQCLDGLCTCEKGWTGDTCERIHFGAARRCGNGGLCLNHTQAAATSNSTYKSTFTSSWGGETIQDEQGRWHLYAAAFDKDSALKEWLNQSRVVHGVSNHSAHGPYVLHDVALGPRSSAHWDGVTQHNPAMVRDPSSGTYLLYYMGSTRHDDDSCPSTVQTACNQRIGLATSIDPNGPFTRVDTPILQPGPVPSWDDQFTTNPTPHVFPNGSVLLLYKARSKENYNVMSTGVAFAEHWSGPYERMSARPIQVPGTCEDAGMYYSTFSKLFRIVLHCGCNYQTIWSKNGMDWHKTAPEQPWCHVKYQDGTEEMLLRRERPKWMFNNKNELVGLMTGVFPSTSHDGDSFTLFQSIV